MFEPLYTAAEMRAAEERSPNYPESVPELMERAGTAVAQEAMRAFPEALTCMISDSPVINSPIP